MMKPTEIHFGNAPPIAEQKSGHLIIVICIVVAYWCITGATSSSRIEFVMLLYATGTCFAITAVFGSLSIITSRYYQGTIMVHGATLDRHYTWGLHRRVDLPDHMPLSDFKCILLEHRWIRNPISVWRKICLHNYFLIHKSGLRLLIKMNEARTPSDLLQAKITLTTLTKLPVEEVER